MPRESLNDMPLTPDAPVETVTLQVQPVGPITAEALPPTLDQAFLTLCQALAAALEDDLPGQAHAEDIQGWYTNGGGNIPIAWAHAIMLLERVVGVKLGA